MYVCVCIYIHISTYVCVTCMLISFDFNKNKHIIYDKMVPIKNNLFFQQNLHSIIYSASLSEHFS